MKALSVMAGLLMVFFTIPIWYYLLYQILVRVDASQLMMFLFWVYVPVGIFIAVVGKLVEATKD